MNHEWSLMHLRTLCVFKQPNERGEMGPQCWLMLVRSHLYLMLVTCDLILQD